MGFPYLNNSNKIISQTQKNTQILVKHFISKAKPECQFPLPSQPVSVPYSDMGEGDSQRGDNTPHYLQTSSLKCWLDNIHKSKTIDYKHWSRVKGNSGRQREGCANAMATELRHGCSDFHQKEVV